jgi:anti-sigma-K factor RskA
MTPEEEGDDKDVLAAEYVLGTLSPDERAQAQALIVVDPGFGEIVRNWERKLGELNVLVAPVEPPAGTWDRIKAGIADTPPSAEVRLPQVPIPIVEAPQATVTTADTLDLRRRMRRWRRISVSMTTLAAAIAAFAVIREFRPDSLPAQLRPKPNVQVVEVVKQVEVPIPKPAQYVAILQKNTNSPAFLLTFDLDKRLATVRTVGAERQSGKSYELWLVSDKFPAPRSLGVIANDQFSVQPQLASYDAATINSATYAVSIEPVGGSPTGIPTGPVVYTGKLIQTTAPGFGGQTP